MIGGAAILTNNRIIFVSFMHVRSDARSQTQQHVIACEELKRGVVKAEI